MAGGKGGSQTVTTAIPKWQEDMVKDAVAQAKGLNVPYAPYMGVDVVGQDPRINNNLNSALSSFGMEEVANNLPPMVTENGISGYKSYDLYTDQLAKLKENYPDIYRRIEAQTAESLPPPSTMGQVNPVTGYPITPMMASNTMGSPTPTSSGSSNDDNYFPPITTIANNNDNGEYSFFDSGTYNIDMNYDPIQDFTDWLSGDYDYPDGLFHNDFREPTP
ncbi:MAG: hypothetical protein CMP92_00325 [Gammaproteobacteria bacterium]|mgnify:FL=1|nr:hypothetical protein [Gammaproteobacteria bacterium]